VDSIQNQQNYKGELLDTGDIFKLGKIHFGVITIVNTLYST